MTRPLINTPPVFSDVLDKHRQRLYRFLRRRLANEDDAKELAQESFLRLLRVARSELVIDPQAYLYRVARNLVYEQGCKALQVGRWADESELNDLEDPSDSPEMEVDRATMNQTLAGIVAELPARQQAIVLLFCHEGLSQREIGERLGLSKSMIQKCLAQGLAHCRKRLRAMSGPARRRAGAR